MAAALDLRKLHKLEYTASKTPVLLAVGPASYLAVDGSGPPAAAEFQEAIPALYPVAYTLKFQSKAAGRDYKVMGLECLWRAPQPAPGGKVDLEGATWRLLLRVPDFVTRADLANAVKALKGKGKAPRAKVKLVRLREGRCVQALHVGPYGKEASTLAAMDAAAREQGLALRGLHHEIYLSDPGRTAPAKLRTLLRHPVGKASASPGRDRRPKPN